jgi:hypothetical protein
METLTVYPALVESARRLRPGRPIWLGPCTIGARHNAYGAAVASNPHGGRVPSARFDPRQGALLARPSLSASPPRLPAAASTG